MVESTSADLRVSMADLPVVRADDFHVLDQRLAQALWLDLGGRDQRALRARRSRADAVLVVAAPAADRTDENHDLDRAGLVSVISASGDLEMAPPIRILLRHLVPPWHPSDHGTRPVRAVRPVHVLAVDPMGTQQRA